MKVIKSAAVCATMAIAAISSASLSYANTYASAEETKSSISADIMESSTETTTVPETAAPTETTAATEAPTDEKTIEENVIGLINNYRVSNGCSKLSESASLNEIAQLRSKEINTLLSHYRPNSKIFSTILAEYGITVTYIGEAIATGNDELDTPQEVVDKWIKSEDDNEIILGKNYQYAGLHMADSTNSSYKHNWVLILAGKSSYLDTEKKWSLKGDLNGDGEINSTDAVLALKNYAASLVGTQKNYTASYLKIADVDGDKKITSKDAVKILVNYANRLAGNPSPL